MTVYVEVEQGFVRAEHIAHVGYSGAEGGSVTASWGENVQSFPLDLSITDENGRPRVPATTREANKAAQELLKMISALHAGEGEKRVQIIKFLGSNQGQPWPKYWSVEVLSDLNSHY